MRTSQRIISFILYSVFFLYLALLVRILIVSRLTPSGLPGGGQDAVRAVNLIPFASIRAYLSGANATLARFAFGNVAGNIVAFVPLGAYITLFRCDKRIAVNLLLVLAASLCAELIQWGLAIGSADIDDVILNGLGGLAGILCCRLLILAARTADRARLIAAVLSALGLPVIIHLLFVMNMRF